MDTDNDLDILFNQAYYLFREYFLDKKISI